MPPQAAPLPDKETPAVSPGMFGAPQAAMPVAGPGMPETTVAAAQQRAANAAKPKRVRKAAPKKAAARKKAAKPARASRAARATATPAVAPAPARRGRVASIKLDMQTMMDVLGSTKKKDQEALFAIVAALNPLSKPQRIRVMQGVAKLLTA